MTLFIASKKTLHSPTMYAHTDHDVGLLLQPTRAGTQPLAERRIAAADAAAAAAAATAAIFLSSKKNERLKRRRTTLHT